MAIQDQLVNERYGLYLGDCMEVMQALPDASIHLSVYSPPFAGLYNYSSSERDLSNCASYEEFFEHYAFVVQELARITLPGRMTAVHCMDVPTGNTGKDTMRDFPGDIIRLHERYGWGYAGRIHIWKEPLTVRNRTMTKALAHKSIVEDSIYCTVASSDYLLIFRNKGANPIPVTHEYGLREYVGSQQMPAELLKYKNWKGKQTENRYSHWIWRQYASSNWYDVRLDRVLPYREARDSEDEKHVHPLQLDVIDRALVLWSNPGEVVFTPFMGVGSEVYGAVRAGRFGVGAELKPSYWRQAVKNLAAVDSDKSDQMEMNLEDEQQLEMDMG